MKCPNINSEEWLELVDSVGESTAYKIFNIREDVPNYFEGDTAEFAKDVEEQFSRKTAIKTLVFADLYKLTPTESLIESTYTNYESNIQLSEEAELKHKEILDELTAGFTTEQKENILTGIFSIHNRLLSEPTYAGLPYKEQRQALRKFFVKHMYSIDGKPVPFNLAVTASKLEMEALHSESEQAENAFISYLVDNEMSPILPKSANLSAPTTYDFDMENIVRVLYYDIFRNWDGSISQYNNFTEKAWAQQFEDYLPKLGVNVVVQTISDVDAIDGNIGSEENQEKIYGKSHLEDSRKDTLSAKTKAFLSDIEKDTVGLLGINDRYDLNEVYIDVVAVSTGTMTYNEFLTDLKKSGTDFGKDHLIKVHDKLINSPVNVQANLWHQMALHHQEFLMLRTEDFGSNTLVKLIKSNQYTKRKTLIKAWNSQMIRNENNSDNNELFIQVQGKDEVITYLNQGIATQVLTDYKQLLKDLKSSKELTDTHIENFESLIKLIGLFDKAQDIKPWVKQYLEAGIRKKGSPVLAKNRFAMLQLLDETTGLGLFVNTFQENGIVKNITSETPDKYESIINIFADIQVAFDQNLFGSFVNVENKTIYPENLRTPMSETLMELKRGGYYNNHVQDVYFSPLKDVQGSGQYRTLWEKMLNDTQIRDAFTIEQFDGNKEKNLDPDVYTDLVEKNSYELRLNLFLNRGNSQYTYLALPTQADRGRLDAMKVPRVDGAKTPLTSLNLTVAQIIEYAFVQEMFKVARNRNDVVTKPVEQLFENYHYTKKDGKVIMDGRGLEIGGMFSDIQFGPKFYWTTEKLTSAISDINSPYKAEYESLIKEVNDMFNSFLDTQTNLMVERMRELNVFNNDIIDGERVLVDKYGKKLTDSDFHLAASKLSTQDIKPFGSFDNFIRTFLLNDIIHKNEAIKAFRVDKSFSKNYVDFIKRFGTVSTPGYMLFMQGDSTSNPEYGFLNQLNEIVIEDIQGTNRELYEYLDSQGYEWAESYKPEKVNATDAQGWMSIDTYRSYLMGLGEWDMIYDEGAFKNYKAGGAFMFNKDGRDYFPRIKPIKPYQEYQKMENGMMVMHSIKNSYMVLLRDFTKNSPRYESLRLAMESNTNPIHLVNTVSTRKLAKGGVHKITDKVNEFADVKVNIVNGRTFRVPQIKPDSDSASDTLLGSQSMRLIMSNNPDSTLFSKYQDVVSSMVYKSRKELFEELQYKPEGMNKEERTKFLINLKKKLISSADSSNQGFTKNQLKALDIIDGDFRVPLSFPVYAKRYEQLMFSLFRNEIMNQKMNGKQVVQAAELGGFTIDENNTYNLKSMRIEDGKVQKAQVMVSIDVAKKLGWKLGKDVQEELSNMITDFIGYRIPTQGKNSMLAFEIVGILPSNYESTVIVPAEITVQMGSDFDIDSLFLMMPNIEKVESGVQKIDANLEQEFTDATDRKVLQNAVYNIFEQVLMNPDNFAEIMKPLDSTVLSDLVKEFKTEPTNILENGYNTEIELQLRNKDGNAGIGIYANALMGHVTGQHMTEKLSVTTPLKFGKTYKDAIVYDSLHLLVDREGNLIENNFSQHLTASLDNAKTPLMSALNDNSFTSPVTIYMLSMGATLKDAFLLRNHPIIRRLTEHYMNNGYTPSSLSIAIQEISEEFVTSEEKGDKNINSHPEILDIEAIEQDVRNKTTNVDVKILLNNFEKFYKAGQDLIKLHKALSPNRISDMSQNSAIQEYLDVLRYVEGPATSIQINGDINESYKLNQAYIDSINSAVNFSKEFFPYYSERIISTKESIKEFTGRHALNKEQHNAINELFYLWMFTDDNSPLKDTFTQNKAKELLLDPGNISDRYKLLKKTYPEFVLSNPLLSLIVPDARLTPKGIQKLHFVNAYANDIGLVDRQIDAFKAILNSENADIRQFGIDLVDYTLLTTGFMSSAESLIRVIPIEHWQESGMVEHFNEMLQINSENLNHEEIADQIVRHNVQTKNFLHTVSLKQNELKNTVYFSDYGATTNRLMSVYNDTSTLLRFFKAYDRINKKFVLYQYIESNDKGHIYVKTPELGEKYNLIEMNLSGPAHQSVLSEKYIQKGYKPTIESDKFNLVEDSIFDKEIISSMLNDTKAKENFLIGNSKDIYSVVRKQAFSELSSDAKNRILKNIDRSFELYIANVSRLATRSSTKIDSVPTQYNVLTAVSNSVQKSLLEFEPLSGEVTTDHLVNTFKSYGVDVTIIMDETIEGFGEVTLDGDKATIRLKSERQTDTEYHEFGHIYLELLEANNAKLIDDGISQLSNDFMQEIASLYPDLSGRELGKEALVTAIGKESAAVKDMAKWRIWLNRLWYATRKLFGLQSNNIARELALDLVSGKLKSNSTLLNRVTMTRYQLAQQKRTEFLISNMIAKVDEEIVALKQQASKDDIRVLNKKYLKSRLESLNKRQDVLKSEITAIQLFIKSSYNDALRIARFTEKMKTMNSSQRPLYMKEIALTIHNLNKQELLMDANRELRNLVKSLPDIDIDSHKQMLSNTLEILDSAKEDIMNFGIPAMADSLLPYASKDVIIEVEEMIKSLEDGNNILRIERFVLKSPQYAVYKKQYEKNLIGATPAETELAKKEFDDVVKQLKIEKLKNLNPTRENIISILKEGFTENNLFSQLLDPTIYSSDLTVSLFTLLVKDKLETARTETLDDRNTLNELFEKVKRELGTDAYNVNKMNEPILETVKMTSFDSEGNKTTIEALSLVQELDINRYYDELNLMYDTLHKKYNVPDKGNGLDFMQWKEENYDSYTAYNKERALWYEQNTEGVDGWRDIYNEKKAQLEDIRMKRPITLEGTEEYYNLDLLEGEIENFLSDHVSVYGKKVTPIKSWSKPRKDKYENKKYKDLFKPENKTYLEFYNAIKNFYFQQQDKVGNHYYPNKNIWEKHSYLMPSIRKTDQDLLIEDGLVAYVKDKTTQLKILDTDSEKIEFNKVTTPIKSIPVYYNGLVNQKEVSRDIFKSMLSTAGKANEFKAKTELLGHVNTFDFLLGNRKSIELDNRGRAVLDVFKKRNNVPQTGTVSGYTTTEYAHFREFVNHIIFGETSEKATIAFGNADIDGNKLVGQINKFAAYNIFPFNFLQGVANVTHGNLLIFEEALAGKFFTIKDFRKGYKDYIKYLPGLTNDIGKNLPESFLGQLIEFFDAQEGKTMEQLTANIFGNKLKNIAKADQLMFLQRSGELQLAVVPLLAMLHNNKITTKDGKEIPLIEIFEMKNNKLTIKNNVDFTREDKRLLMNKVQGLNRSLQGIYDKFNRSAITKYWWGKSLMLFRSWMLSAFRRNLGYAGKNLRVDHEMGQVTDGIFNTFFQFLFNPYTTKNYNYFDNYKKLQPFEKRNMVKALSRLSTITMAYIAGSMLKGGDEDEWARNFSYYQLRRLRSEMSFWLNPLEAMNLLQSPAAGTLVVEKLTKFTMQSFDPFAEYERKTGVKQKGDNKLYWRTKELFPILHNLDKIRTPEESAKYLDRLF